MKTSPDSARDFSVILGGPLYQLLLRSHLTGPHLTLLYRRMFFIAAIAWLPLLVLTLAEGRALGGVKVPLLVDIETYARFLIALPILVAAELLVHRRIRGVVQQFFERDIVPVDQTPRFQAAIDSALRLRNSITAEVVLLVGVLVLGPVAWRNGLVLPVDTWYANVTGETVTLTGAGWWFVHLSIPIFQFILLRWYFRLFIWGRFLWQVSRLPLVVRPTHPDRAGGFAFLAGSAYSFAPVLFAQGVLLSGLIASRVLFAGQSALDFRIEAAALVVVFVVIIVTPLLFFAPRLASARRVALREYGALASDYVHEFDRKWLRGGAAGEEALVGSADIQSLADLAGSYDIVREMMPFPFGRRMLIQLVVATAAPLAPLVLTVIPFHELMDRLFKVLL